jgi:hypothetical protein
MFSEIGRYEMKRVQDDEHHEHVELSPEEARQGRPDLPVVYVLIGLVAGTILAIGAIYAYFY